MLIEMGGALGAGAHTDLLHQSLQRLPVLPQAALHPRDHLGVQLPVARQHQVVLQHHLQLRQRRQRVGEEGMGKSGEKREREKEREQNSERVKERESESAH